VGNERVGAQDIAGAVCKGNHRGSGQARLARTPDDRLHSGDRSESLTGTPERLPVKSKRSDKRVPASDTTGDSKGDVDYGGSVEVFATANEAKARAAYIESVLKADPMLGTEYDYLNGPVLLRVSQYLIPSQAEEYQRALAKIKV
jgi:hypothetical protein